MRHLRRAVAVVLALPAVLLGLMVLGILVPRGPDRAFSAQGEGTRAVFVTANPIHTDLVLPVTPELLARFGFLAEDGLPLDHPDLGAILVGWGGRAFYTQTPTWGDLKAEAVWRSVTRDRSVLHLALGPAIAEGASTRRLDLGPEAYEALVGFVEASFLEAPDGRPQVLAGSYGPFDRFYEARGRFNLFLGCNTWTAAALRAAGVSTGLWTPLPRSLFWALDLHAGP